MMIMYPSNGTSLLIGRRLVAEDFNVYFFCPSDVYVRAAGTIVNDLKISAVGLTVKVEMKQDVQSIEFMDMLIFPALDFLPDIPRAEFAQMTRALFRLFYQVIFKVVIGLGIM